MKRLNCYMFKHNICDCDNTCGYNDMEIKQHGGKRKGAGRKPKEPTKTIRVPVSLIPKIKELIRLK